MARDEVEPGEGEEGGCGVHVFDLTYGLGGGEGEVLVGDDVGRLHEVEGHGGEEHLAQGQRVGVGEVIDRQRSLVEEGDRSRDQTCCLLQGSRPKVNLINSRIIGAGRR